MNFRIQTKHNKNILLKKLFYLNLNINILTMFFKINEDITKHQYNLNELEKILANKLKYAISSFGKVMAFNYYCDF